MNSIFKFILTLCAAGIPFFIMFLIFYFTRNTIPNLTEYNNSLDNLPGGRSHGGRCFHPYTLVEVNDSIKCIKDIQINDILSDGSKVLGTMILSGKNQEMYSLQSKSRTIIVSGTHVIHTSIGKQYIKNYKLAKQVSPCNILYCLITSTHKIPIDNLVFSDWYD